MADKIEKQETVPVTIPDQVEQVILVVRETRTPKTKHLEAVHLSPQLDKILDRLHLKLRVVSVEELKGGFAYEVAPGSNSTLNAAEQDALRAGFGVDKDLKFKSVNGLFEHLEQLKPGKIKEESPTAGVASYQSTVNPSKKAIAIRYEVKP